MSRNITRFSMHLSAKARRFAAMPGFREQAMVHKHDAIRLARSDAERAKAEAVEITA